MAEGDDQRPKRASTAEVSETLDSEPRSPPSDAGQSNARNVFVPVLIYTPETHVALGGFFVHMFRIAPRTASQRTSSAAFIALGTSRGQAVLEFHPDIYWWHDALHLSGRVQYQYYPDNFWGIGNTAEYNEEERYVRERARAGTDLQYRLGTTELRAGLAGDLMLYKGHYRDPQGLFATNDVPGEPGGLSAGAGPALSYDTRDNTVAPRSGTYVTSTLLRFDRRLGSRYQFYSFTADGRQFIPLGEHVIALRGHFVQQGGSVPYYQLAMIGGDELLRGYYLGRFRDKNLVASEAEYRSPLFWRVGAVVFGGVGRIAASLGDVARAPTRWAVGTGARFALDPGERLNLRLDVGVGPNTHGVYFTAREAF